MNKMTEQNIMTSTDYQRFLEELKVRVVSARISAARAVNRDLVLLYWDIGRKIIEKQKILGWGESVIDQVSCDLQKAFPSTTGFSPRNLRDMKRFYLAYVDAGIWRQVVAKLERMDETSSMDLLKRLVTEIPWGHNLLLLNKVTEPIARLYYLRSTAQYGWSRNVLLLQIKAHAYERAVMEKKTHNFPLAMPEYLAEQADEMLKSSYNLEFLGIRHEAKERELEDRLISHLTSFLLELGYGFCFVGRQYRLTLGQKEYFIDLLFYHRFLNALVAFELKGGPFKPEHAGKMDFYLNLLNDKERKRNDRPSIGIILCAEKDDVEVEYALRAKKNPIGVAAYHLQSELPKNLAGQLPTAEQLTSVVRGVFGSKIIKTN